MEKKFSIRVRLVIIRKNKILLSYAGKENFYFFPGGKVEFRETLKKAAAREIKEECNAEFTFIKPLYIRDFFGEFNVHNLEIYILGKIDKLQKVKDKEHPDHQQVWKKLKELSGIDVRPRQLVPILIKDYNSGFFSPAQYLGEIE